MDAGTDSEGGRWMSYQELAALRGIDKQSAIKLTFRRHWRRQKDNRGTVQVLVPSDWLAPQRPSRDQSNLRPYLRAFGGVVGLVVVWTGLVQL